MLDSISEFPRFVIEFLEFRVCPNFIRYHPFEKDNIMAMFRDTDENGRKGVLLIDKKKPTFGKSLVKVC
jgi:hypothetical protein